MSGPPFTDLAALQKWSGNYAQLVAAYPAPSIWNGFLVFTSDQGWCFWLGNQGWVAYSSWVGTKYERYFAMDCAFTQH